MRVAAATIAARNHLPHARVIARSLAEHHPDLPLYTLIADAAGDAGEDAREPFTAVPMDALAIPDPVGFRFAYDQQPLSYAATPYLVEHVLDQGFDAVLFVKQESLVTGDLSSVLDPLRDGASLVLTPHLLAPRTAQDELVILLSGTFNGGVLGVGSTPAARAFLAWWADRLQRHCVLDVARGLHYEQRWLDLAPTLFGGTRIVRDPGVNIGHWNLHERAGALADCRLFRLSGYTPDAPGTLTRYFPERRPTPEAQPLIERFRAALEAAGWAEASRRPYAWARFDNGAPIPPLARELYRGLDAAAAQRFGDPFATAGPESFFTWLNEREDGAVTRLWRAVLERRVDVREAFPDPGASDAAAFARWARADGAREYDIPDAFLAA